MDKHIKLPTVAALAFIALFPALPTQAALVSYDFAVTIDTTTSPLFDQTFLGSFSFDDTQAPMPGLGGEDLYALQDFTFDFAAQVYGLGDLFYADTAFLAGQFLGLDAAGLSFSFLPASAPFPASFAYDFGQGDAGNGTLAFTPAAVPEPGMIGLMGGALFVLAVWRRRGRTSSKRA